MKICNKCAVPKEEDKFEKGRGTCRKCRESGARSPQNRREYHKEYQRRRRADPIKNEKRKETRRIYHSENREEISAKEREYRVKNRPTLNAKRRERKKRNPNIRIRERLVQQIRRAIANDGATKSKKTLELLGCSIEEFKTYIAGKFKDGMTWENYGYDFWHLDHIYPCYAFDLTNPEHQKKCFHYKNLQPLLAKENLVKNKSFDQQKFKQYLES